MPSTFIHSTSVPSTSTGTEPTHHQPRLIRLPEGHTLILGGGFGGAHVARLIGRDGATIVSPTSTMLYTPLLPEIAGGAIEPRHGVVPLRLMCPEAQLLRGRVAHLDEDARRVLVETETGPIEVEYSRLVIALGSEARMLPIPGLAERAMPLKELADAIRLRDHMLRMLELADTDPANRDRYLTFVFVGAGYAGVEALAETLQLLRDVTALRPRLTTCEPRWVLVNAGPRILAEVPGGLGTYAARLLEQRGVEVLNETTLVAARPGGVTLSDGSEIESDTLVWTAGVTPHPLARNLGLPVDPQGRILVDSTLRVRGRHDIWALGDCAQVPNAASPTRPDPPTCQHALRQARHLAASLRGSTAPYRYRSIGEGATLGADRGIARFLGLRLRGRLAAILVRGYHVRQVPVRSRRLRIVADGLLSRMLRRDIADLGLS